MLLTKCIVRYQKTHICVSFFIVFCCCYMSVALQNVIILLIICNKKFNKISSSSP